VKRGVLKSTSPAKRSMLKLSIFALMGLRSVPGWAENVNGKALYEGKCGGCHSLDMSRVGPLHRGVVGRKIASVQGFGYSPAIRKLNGVWTPALLDRWLTNPQAVAPGSNMYFEVPDAGQRQAIISYLIANSPPPTVPRAGKTPKRRVNT
jgi:cytochrome c